MQKKIFKLILLSCNVFALHAQVTVRESENYFLAKGPSNHPALNLFNPPASFNERDIVSPVFDDHTTTFDWNALTTQSPTTYNAHSGTTVINGKKFTNLNSGVQGGTCIKIGPTAGTGTITIKNCYFGASIGE